MSRMILLNPGPANTTATVKQALQVDDICPREKAFGEVLLRVRAGLTKVVHAGSDYSTVMFCGSGTAGVEAAICSTVPPAGRLLVVDNGSYGARMQQIAAAYGIPHDSLTLGVGTRPDVAAIDAQLASGRYTQLAVVHHETSTGMLNPVQQLATAAHARGCEVIVDAMSSYAGIPIDIAELGADWLVSSSNKCIQGMAGLSFVIGRCARLAELPVFPGRSYYLNMVQQHRYLEAHGQMQFTPPVQVVYALDQALREYFAEGAVARHARYMDNFRVMDDGIRQLGFRRLMTEDVLSRILTAYLEPDHPNYDFERFHDALYTRGFTIYPGKGALHNTFRLANMGAIDASNMRDFVTAVATVLEELQLAPLYSAAVPPEGACGN